MMTSDVETSQAFNYVLSPHERCIRGENNNNNKKNINNNNSNNNVRNIHVAFEKNLNVFVRDHLENVTVPSGENGDDSTASKAVDECSSSKSSVSKTEEPRLSSSSSIGSDPDPNLTHPGQQPDKNTSRKETMPASSLVQIWEARTTQQPPSQNQTDSRTSSSGSNVLENSESLNEETPIKEPETIQPIQEGSNEDDKEEEIESDSQSVSGEKEREGVRVMDIIRKLSSDTETTTANNDNGGSSNDNGKEVQTTTTTTTTETRSFPQVSCPPRIRGRQAFADLLVQMMRDREKELVCLLDRHCVSKFTHRGRIQSTLRIRCYERCIAIQDKYRSKSWAAGTDLNRAGGSDLNRSPRGFGVMHLLKEKNKTNSGNIETSSVSSRSKAMDKDAQKSLEKKVVEETMEKIDVKEVQEVVSAVETAKKAVLSELVENKNGLKKPIGETIKEIAERRGEKQETMAQEVVSAVKTAKKAVLSELVENKNGLKKSTGETIKEEVGERRGEKREAMAQEVVSGVETAKKAVLSEIVESKNGLKKSTGETIKKEVGEKRGEKRETMAQEVVSAVKTAKKAVLSELVENKNGLKKSTEETIKKEVGERRGEKREAMAQEVVSVVETAKKAVLSELLESKNGLKKSLAENIKKEVAESRGEKRETKEKPDAKEGLEGRGEKRETKEKPDAKEGLEGRGEKETAKKAVLSQSAEEKSGLKKPIGETLHKESTKGRGDEGETKEKAIAKENVQGNALVGIAEKVNRWNSEEKMNRSKWTEKVKTESKTNTERVDKNDALEDATRRTINVQSGARSNTTCDFPEKEVKRKEKDDCPQQGTTAQEEEKVMQETTKSDLSETKNNKNGLKKPTEKESREVRAVEEESVEGNTFIGIAEKVNMWNSKAKRNRRRYSMDRGRGKGKTGKPIVLQEASRKIINEISNTTSKEKVVGTQDIKDKRESTSREIMCESEEKVRRKKEEELCSGEAKSKDIIEVKIMSSQEVIIPAHESPCHGSPERGKEINPSPQGEEMFILQNLKDKSTKEIDGNKNIIEEVSREKVKEKNPSQQDEEVKEVATEFANDWDENEVEEEDDDDYEDYYGEISTDWIYDIARPRSYWEELRKERYLEVLNAESDKKDICNLIQSRTVSNFLTSDLRQKIDNLMTSLVHNHLSVPNNQEGDEDDEEEEECSARNQEDNETEEEPEKTNLEAASDNTILEATDLDACSQSSERSSTLMISWSFRDQDIDKDHEPTASLSLPEPSSATSQTTQEMQMIRELREQMEQLQREMLELRNTVKSCTDMQFHFQKSVTQDSGSSAEQRVETKNPLKRKCCVCSEMPVDSLLYRCGHMCTCLKCAHELQWSSKKCPICMAPIVDVVRAFLDA